MAILLVLSAPGCQESGPAGPPDAPASPAAVPTVQQDGRPAGSVEGEPPLDVRRFPSPAAALQGLLAESRPRVLGVGEIHQSVALARVPSAIRRFGDKLVQVLAGRASDLVVETWVSTGGCGETEQRVVAEVAETTQRPAETENEIVRLLKRARAAGLASHILTATCADYQGLSGAGGEVDYERLLVLTTDKLRAVTTEILAQAKTAAGPGLVVVYGGAVHNDAAPAEGLESFAYAPQIRQLEQVAGRYVELDLWVPEYVAQDPTQVEVELYRRIRPLISARETLLVRRAPGASSYVLVFPSTAAPGPPPPLTPPRSK